MWLGAPLWFPKSTLSMSWPPSSLCSTVAELLALCQALLSTFPAEAVGLNGKKGQEIQAGAGRSAQPGHDPEGSTWCQQDTTCLSRLLSQCGLSTPFLFTSQTLPSIKPPFPGSSVGKDSTCNAGAAAAAKSHQSCPALCDPIDGSPPGSTIPGILQARTLEWVAISFSNA